ncbi:putative exported protein [Pectobacterium atrosepticum SCRI1043]|uniref:Exported protein n=1 Tax=Pectobacterium atrosepticum (strain SCRI 1043 / ATCC BAA-672) TaxID=218491 RepID=Q6D5N1_PECAS|nr:type 1 fimbrial protein [Pectobacterium atrosepticum]MCL6315970.1 type 1 fimbrial protein [Pectobacterium atrosepticum]MCL6319794.1 type 1 fimbrial protein [Pectobacterium atrosepticum]CAG74911.1 putative exported protein [Pectobacterium atrosepticum SCRI1043]
MKKILQISAILLSTMTATSYTFASPSAGIIRFSGAIVEPVCDVTTHSNNVTVSCERQGEVQTLQMKNSSQHAALPQGIGSVSSKILNSDARIVIVSYE